MHFSRWRLLPLLAAVFAYGQTGSGKTYTMGSAFTPGGSTQGVIPSVMDDIFARISSTKDADYTVRVGFVEIHQVNRVSACIALASPQTAAQQPRGRYIHPETTYAEPQMSCAGTCRAQAF